MGFVIGYKKQTTADYDSGSAMLRCIMIEELTTDHYGPDPNQQYEREYNEHSSASTVKRMRTESQDN